MAEKKYYAGCDVGSTTTKAVVVTEDDFVASVIIPSTVNPEESAREALEKVIEQIDDIREITDFTYLVGTGYGRTEVPFADKNISELSCHGMGAFSCDNGVRSIVDIGGQDTKAILLNDDGTILDFAMNDKCAAGTGKFFEGMGRVFGMDFVDFSKLSLNAKKATPVTSQCSVFAESEVLSLISNKVPPAEIALGIQESVAKRCLGLLRRIGYQEKVAMTGGVAKNIGMVTVFKKMLKTDIVQLDKDPQLMGALGAALLARKSG
jgi:predicted CoA-substrate-specific enzyme activase